MVGLIFVSGWTKVSLLDYPGHLCSVVFLSGCNLRCVYCHNKELVNGGRLSYGFSWDEILRWLEKNKQMIDGVCFTGGEPTLCNDLASMIYDVKKISLKVKVDTNGTQPKVLEKLLLEELVDFVAMDIKAPLDKYEQICKTKVSADDLYKSVDLIKTLSPEYEFRTTFHPSILTIDDFHQICEWLKGASKYVVQCCRTGNNLDPIFSKLPPVRYEDVMEIAEFCSGYFTNFVLRGFTDSLQKVVGNSQRV
ncbi:MAG: anaerobic ribonucleoside-triphosphate reductase activating protein [Pseudothermotoga sp.]